MNEEVIVVIFQGLDEGGNGGFGLWAEQLIAESTGKDGKGLIPVGGEPVAAPDAYGKDRVFAYLRLQSAPDESQPAIVNSI